MNRALFPTFDRSFDFGFDFGGANLRVAVGLIPVVSASFSVSVVSPPFTGSAPMAVTSYRIEEFFEEHDLKFFRRIDEPDAGSWVLLFGSQTVITIRLLEDGECLLFRSLPILNLDESKPRHRAKVWETVLSRNDNLLVGHYSGSKEVCFEMTLPIEDGEVSNDQLGRILSTVSREVIRFGPKLRALAAGKKVDLEDDGTSRGSDRPEEDGFPNFAQDDDESIEDLMQRLFHQADDDKDDNHDRKSSPDDDL